MSRHRILSALLTAGALFFAPLACADELQEISKLAKQGQHATALDRLNGYLASHPKDAQARFLKGLILTEQNKPADAITVFTALTQDYPELPEPYNNLAVLYASQQQYDKARIALEMAIRTHPSYATAHENLGDIYAKLASLSYDKALQLDKGNASAQTKLSMVRELFIPASRSGKPAAKSEPVKQPVAPVAAATVKPLAPAVPLVAAPLAPVVSTPAKPVAAAAKTASAESQASAKPAPVAEPKEDKQAANSESKAVLESVNAWAKAWSNRNVSAYLAAYGKEFKAPGGNRAAWEKSRKERLSNPKHIQVAVVAPEVRIENDEHATVSFKQLYRSDTLKTSTRKTLVMVKSGSKWVIQEERVSH